MAKPTELPEWASTPQDPADIVVPSAGRKLTGWHRNAGVPEKPPYQLFNWLHNLTYRWIQWIASLIGDDGTVISFGDGRPLFLNGLTVVETIKESVRGFTSQPNTCVNLGINYKIGAGHDFVIQDGLVAGDVLVEGTLLVNGTLIIL